MDEIRVSPETMQRYVEELGRLGEQPEGGLIRFQYDAAWCRARDLLRRWIEEAGLDFRMDAAGNVFGRLIGDDDSRTILTGSHIDTVPYGGKYDGALGVVAGLAALRALAEQVGTPRRSLEVVALCEEESSRFQANFFGTRAILGLVDANELDELHDGNGVSLRTAMQEAQLDPEGLSTAARDDLDAFIELHIEQGRMLEEHAIDIGIVTVVTGLVWESIEVVGRTDHAGGTPMHLRRDAAQAAAEIAIGIRRLAESAGPPAVATTGRWEVEPGWPSAVPGLTRLSLDLRHTDLGTRDHLLDEVHRLCEATADSRGVQVQITKLKDEVPSPLDAGLADVFESAAQQCGASLQRMPSGAGHDSQLMAQHVRTGMIFVPSVDGRSHCPEEFTSAEDCARGASVLATSLHHLAYQHGALNGSGPAAR